MKKTLIGLFIVSVLISSCGVYKADFLTESCVNPEPAKTSFSKAAELEKVLEELTQNGAPGVALAVSSDEGSWSMAKGYARLEDKTPMQTCHLQYLQSVSKTYMAVAILKLYEQGKIDLDEPMTKYLPQKYHHYIAGADKITVRMLLNHTSGIAEYNFDPVYVSTLLQNPEKDFTPENYLRFIKKKSSQFEPGSKHVYINTNYEILALIGDALTGDHTKFISETIFKPLGLTNTFYRSEPGYLLGQVQ
jgi:D-alanyl-D-alanine carboxypeptidase